MIPAASLRVRHGAGLPMPASCLALASDEAMEPHPPSALLRDDAATLRTALHDVSTSRHCLRPNQSQVLTAGVGAPDTPRGTLLSALTSWLCRAPGYARTPGSSRGEGRSGSTSVSAQPEGVGWEGPGVAMVAEGTAEGSSVPGYRDRSYRSHRTRPAGAERRMLVVAHESRKDPCMAHPPCKQGRLYYAEERVRTEWVGGASGHPGTLQRALMRGIPSRRHGVPCPNTSTPPPPQSGGLLHVRLLDQCLIRGDYTVNKGCSVLERLKAFAPENETF